MSWWRVYCELDIPAQMSTTYLELIMSGEIISLNLADVPRLPNFSRWQPNPSSHSRPKTSSVIYCLVSHPESILQANLAVCIQNRCRVKLPLLTPSYWDSLTVFPALILAALSLFIANLLKQSCLWRWAERRDSSTGPRHRGWVEQVMAHFDAGLLGFRNCFRLFHYLGKTAWSET